MRRAPFLGAGVSVLLAGCGGNHVLQALPGVASTSSNVGRPKAGTLVPVSADAIPANVLSNPLIGEGRRFDGLVAPPNWTLAAGQTVNVADNPHLFSILKTTAGGDGTTTFRLPNPGFGYIVAVAGMFPNSPTMLAQSGSRRTTSFQASLGPGATASVPMHRLDTERDRAVAASLRSIAAAPRSAPPAFTPVSPEMNARFTASQVAARDAARVALTPANAATLDSVLERVANGASSLNDAVVRMTSVLTISESTALLEINDARMRAFHSGWAGATHPDPQLEAARFVVSIGFSPDQQRRFAARQE